MAVSKYNSTIDTTDRDTLSGANVDVGSLGVSGMAGVESLTGLDLDHSDGLFGKIGSMVQEITGQSTAKLAGVTSDFAQQFAAEMEEYIKNVITAINKIDDADSKVAFAGTEVGRALTTFIEGVKTVATSYVNKLKAAENQIVGSVAQAYKDQDTHVNTELTNDTGTLNNSAVQ